MKTLNESNNHAESASSIEQHGGSPPMASSFNKEINHLEQRSPDGRGPVIDLCSPSNSAAHGHPHQAAGSSQRGEIAADDFHDSLRSQPHSSGRNSRDAGGGTYGSTSGMAAGSSDCHDSLRSQTYNSGRDSHDAGGGTYGSTYGSTQPVAFRPQQSVSPYFSSQPTQHMPSQHSTQTQHKPQRNAFDMLGSKPKPLALPRPPPSKAPAPGQAPANPANKAKEQSRQKEACERPRRAT